MTPLIFSHANSFGASTYAVLFDSLRARGFSVDAIERFGHDAKYPVTDNWPHLVQQLIDFAQARFDATGQAHFLVGHSFGGFVSLMAAAQAPHLARGVVLVDSPILGGWRATTFSVMKTTQIVGAVSPGAVSRTRRNSWPSQDAAFEHFRHKKAFAKWDERVLRDYIAHGTHDEGKGSDKKRMLSFDRAVETQIYNTVPDNLDRLLKRHPLKCPVAFIGGRSSVEMKQVGMGMTEKVTKGRIMMLDGSHLFPMEKPLATAAALEAALRNMET
ncbi:alpha/beta fold hydrolase [Rhodoferax aquaticus]|uniref:Alpha/beta hydrolase n=1 Tax=Rhodoferax aquaticus TaxID=2527691 RepID=A0A515EQU1_9BURK|nr:alpha/beta hydrolase [Rhodoferax aquaticus]QDL55010.1 alpha/beta hydrolase [Rhodoferax aquaticus]